MAAFLTWSGWIVVEEAYRWDERTTSTLQLPLWGYYLCLPVGMALLAFHLVVRTIGIATGRVRDDLGHHEH
jgi:C4-dicarboxylate transporter DctQ subunit